MNHEPSDVSDEIQTGHADQPTNDCQPGAPIRIVRLSDVCKDLAPAHAIGFLLSKRYYGFFVKIPRYAMVYRQSIRNVPTGPSSFLKLPIDDAIRSARLIQLGIDNLEVLACGQPTDAYQFKGCLFAKLGETREDDATYIYQNYEKTLLRPKARLDLDLIPIFTSASGRAVFCRSENPDTGNRRFLIANISASDLFIDVKFVVRNITPFSLINEEPPSIETFVAEDEPPTTIPDISAWPFNVEVEDPHNFKELCPFVFEAMQIAQFRANDPIDDEEVIHFLRKRHPKKYRSPLGDKARLRFLAEITRPGYTPKPQLEWKKNAFASFDADAFIAQDCYSTMLRLLMTVAKHWVKSGATDVAFKQAMKDRHFEDGEQGERAGQFSWIITGRFIPIDIHGRAD